MRFLTLQLDENTKIDINNTIWGKETIFYNEEMVSEKTSLLGAVHEFQKEENGHPVSYRVKVGLDLMRGVVYDIFRNEKQIFTNHGNTAKPVKPFLLILIGFLGGILGYLVTTSWLGNLSDTGKLIKGTLIICGLTAGLLILVSSGRKNKRNIYPDDMKTTFNLKRAAGIAFGYMLASIILAEFYPLFKSMILEGKTWVLADYIHQLEVINWLKILFRSAFVGLVVTLISIKTSTKPD